VSPELSFRAGSFLAARSLLIVSRSSEESAEVVTMKIRIRKRAVFKCESSRGIWGSILILMLDLKLLVSKNGTLIIP